MCGGIAFCFFFLFNLNLKINKMKETEGRKIRAKNVDSCFFQMTICEQDDSKNLALSIQNHIDASPITLTLYPIHF